MREARVSRSNGVTPDFDVSGIQPDIWSACSLRCRGGSLIFRSWGVSRKPHDAPESPEFDGSVRHGYVVFNLIGCLVAMPYVTASNYPRLLIKMS